ncbi:MAG: hypothetical protein JWP83_1358 [Mycobacterium sp.]|jgi:hypothetical protein|nr:hypothetical protein [Mycobacterium sp.]
MIAMGDVHAVFALPIPEAQRPMGVLGLYRRTAGGFAAAEYASAAASAAAVSRRLASNWEALVTHFGSPEEALDARNGRHATRDQRRRHRPPPHTARLAPKPAYGFCVGAPSNGFTRKRLQWSVTRNHDNGGRGGTAVPWRCDRCQ